MKQLNGTQTVPLTRVEYQKFNWSVETHDEVAGVGPKFALVKFFIGVQVVAQFKAYVQAASVFDGNTFSVTPVVEFAELESEDYEAIEKDMVSAGANETGVYDQS